MMRCPLVFQRFRVLVQGERGDDFNGALIHPRGLMVIFSSGADWEHVSVSRRLRLPDWDDMEFVKRAFWEPADTVMQLHVPVDEHINQHAFCLHLWRPLAAQIPRPPSWMVGVSGPTTEVRP